MKRLLLILRSPQLLLPALPAVAVAVAITVGSGASFSSSTANPANTFTAGTLTHSNSKQGAAILTAQNMIPGDIKTGTVTITNTGDVAGTFTLSQSNITRTPGPNGGDLAARLDLKIEDTTGSPQTVYTGKLDALTPQNLGQFAAGAARTYTFTVTFPDGGTPASATTGDNAYKQSAASVQFDWNAVS